MKKRLFWFGVIAIGVVGIAIAIVVAYNTMPEPSVSENEVGQPVTPPANDPPAASTDTPGSTVMPGQYKDYSPEAIAATPGTKVLFFHAPWCPQCRALEASILEGEIPDNTTIFKVDYDSNQALRQTYGVTIQTTLVLVDDQGELIAKYVAYDEPTLQAVKDNLLP